MKKVVCIILIVSMIFSTSIYAAETTQYDVYAEKLSVIGVFQGTGNGFELNRPPTRLEGLIMLLRLLGKEEEAMASEVKASVFSDVPAWGVPYTNYAYDHNLTTGVGDGKFGTNNKIQSKSYITFLLRALGYDDSVGDFEWGTAVEFSFENNIISKDMYIELIGKEFLRDHVAKLSYDALYTSVKDGSSTLINYLISMGSIDSELANEMSAEPQNIVFKDDHLKAALLEVDIDTNNDGEISVAEANKFEGVDYYGTKRLDVNQKGIAFIDGLEYFTNVTYLDLGSNPISDLSALENLTNLEELKLGGNEISDISAHISVLKSLTNLTFLYLAYNQISDISTLADLTNLEKLYLDSNEISDISALADLTNLKMLTLGANQISDISAIRNLTNLERLYLYQNPISDISALAKLTNLEEIDLGSDPITDISVLDNLPNLINVRFYPRTN